MVDTIVPLLASSMSDMNLLLNWNGLPGVSYQPCWSTNLINWLPWGSAFPGTNGSLQLVVSIDGEAMKFFQLDAANQVT